MFRSVFTAADDSFAEGLWSRKTGSWQQLIALHRGTCETKNISTLIYWSHVWFEHTIQLAYHDFSSNPALYTIRLGDHNRNVNEGTEQDIKAIRVISHPSYNNPRLSNDIALIQLQRPATLNNRVGLACLPDQDYVLPAGSNCYITGTYYS